MVLIVVVILCRFLCYLRGPLICSFLFIDIVVAMLWPRRASRFGRFDRASCFVVCFVGLLCFVFGALRYR